MSDAIEVTFYTRKHCPLCDKAKAAIHEAQSAHSLSLRVTDVDVDGDRELAAKFGDDVPVIFVNGAEAFRHRVDPEAFARRILGRAPISSSLAQETCVPCRGGVPALAGEELRAVVSELGGGWGVVEGHHLEKEFKFPDFARALAFTNTIGAIAEQQGHHPDIYLGWGKVRVTIWTHAINGLTRSDFVLAAKIDAAETMNDEQHG